jgi:nicotinamidase-related amidase
MKTLLFITDMQNDFCKPEGALYVNGAEQDTARLAKFIRTHSDKIDHIIMTQDNHQVIDISHPGFWEDRHGNSPMPFTVITFKNIHNGDWIPRFRKEEASEYILKLEEQGEFPHVIWPEHCIIGSSGAAIVDEIMLPVREWARRGKFFDMVIKGTNPLTEHFGALRANIPIETNPETQMNKELIRKLENFDVILMTGEAKSHCVANTVKQLGGIKGMMQKLVILEDCMSDVTGFETIALPIYERAGSEGARFALSTGWFHEMPDR